MFWLGRNALFERTFGNIEDRLAAEGSVGSIDQNCIMNENGIHSRQFRPRFGYPTLALQAGSFESPTGEFFADLARANDPGLDVHDGYQLAVGVVPLPVPFDDDETYDESSRNAAVVSETSSREGTHLEDAKQVEGQWRVVGDDGMPLGVTGKGDTMQAAREQVHGVSTTSSCRTGTTATTPASAGSRATATGCSPGATSARNATGQQRSVEGFGTRPLSHRCAAIDVED